MRGEELGRDHSFDLVSRSQRVRDILQDASATRGWRSPSSRSSTRAQALRCRSGCEHSHQRERAFHCLEFSATGRVCQLRRQAAAMTYGNIRRRMEGTMQLVRREFLHLAAAAAVTGATSAASAQAPGPKLIQVLRQDLERQGHVVQESIVSVAEFGPGSAAPWHVHPGAQEIFHVMEGDLVVEMEGSQPV